MLSLLYIFWSRRKQLLKSPFFFPPLFYLCNKVDVGRLRGQLQYFVIIAERG